MLYLFIGSDNIGYSLSFEKIITNYLTNQGIKFDNIGFIQKIMRPFTRKLHLKVAGELERGNINMRSYICATGIVMSITANKTPRIMFPLCDNIFSAERVKKSNNGNVLTLGRYTVGPELANKLVNAWLKSEFQGKGSTKK